MKRIHVWTLLGAAGVGLMAALLGPTVLGQPETNLPLPMPPDLMTPPKDPLELPKAQPALPELKPGDVPMAAPELPEPRPEPAPQILRAEATAPIGKQLANSMIQAAGRQPSAVNLEWIGPAAIRIHQPMPCQILVRNTSSAPVQNVIVRHRLGQGVVVKASDPQAVQENGEVIWDLGTLAPEQTRRIDLTLVAQARGAMKCQASVTFTASGGYLVQVREPMLAVKVRAPEKVVAGETVTLQLAVSNPGDGVAELAKVKVMLPEGLEHPRGKVVEFDVGNVAPSEVRTLDLTCVAKGTGPQNCAIVASADGNLHCDAAANFEILMPKLDIAMTGPKMRYLHRHAVYTLKVTNPSKAPATNVEISEVIPAGFRVHQAPGAQYQDATRVLSWMVGEIQPGQSKLLSLDLIPIKVGEHRLTAQAKMMRGLKTETEMCTFVEGLPSLEIEVNHLDDPIEVGAETAFEIRVANKGTEAETNIEVVCTLPDQLEFVGARCTTTLRFRQEGRDVIFEKLPRLAPRAEEFYRVQVKGAAPGDIRFRTRIRADGLTDPVQREESMRIYSDETPRTPGMNSRSVDPAPLPPPGVPSAPTASSLPIRMIPPLASQAPGSPLQLPMPGALPTPTPVGIPPGGPLIPLPDAPTRVRVVAE